MPPEPRPGVSDDGKTAGRRGHRERDTYPFLTVCYRPRRASDRRRGSSPPPPPPHPGGILPFLCVDRGKDGARRRRDPGRCNLERNRVAGISSGVLIFSHCLFASTKGEDSRKWDRRLRADLADDSTRQWREAGDGAGGAFSTWRLPDHDEGMNLFFFN